MNVRVVVHRPGQLGSFFGDLITIGGAIAGPTAAQAGLPGWAAGLIGAGGQIASLLASKPKGYKPGAGDIDNMVAQYHAFEATHPTAAALRDVAQQIVTTLSDPGFNQNDAYVQAAKGNFVHSIAVLSEIVNKGQILDIRPGVGYFGIDPIAPAGTPAAGTTPVTDPTGTLATTTIGGVSLQTVLILGGGALFVAWLLK